MPLNRRAIRFLSGLVAVGLLLLAALAVGALPKGSQVSAATSEEVSLLQLINGYRQASGLSTLTMSSTLYAAAGWMSGDMARNDYFSHTDSLGRDPFQRMADFGYGYNTWKGENLAAGAADPQQVLELWKASSGHNAVLMNPNFLVVGIARYYDANSTFGYYWAADFGGYGEEAASPQATPTPTPPPPAPPPPAPTPTTSGSPPQLQVAEAGVPEPSTAAIPTPTPEPTPTPTPKPPEPPPDWQTIAQALAPLWSRVVVVDLGDSFLTTISYLAQHYLMGVGEGFVRTLTFPSGEAFYPVTGK